MTKKTHTVYLNEVTHSDVSDYVERALDGRGTVNTFLAFVEERTFAQFGGPRTNAVTSEREGTEADAAYRHYGGLPPGALIEPLTEYERAWQALVRHLPWHETNPIASHVFALRELSERPIAWVNGAAERRRAQAAAAQEADGDGGLKAAVDRVRDRGRNSRSVSPAKGAPRQYYFGQPIWKRGRVDLVWQASSAPTSFYLEPEPHAFLNNAFPDISLFQFSEDVLLDVFQDEGLWIDIAPEVTLLDKATSISQASELANAIKHTADAIVASWEPDGHDTSDNGNVFGDAARQSFNRKLASGLAKLDRPRWNGAPLGDDLQESWGVQLLRLARRLNVLDLEDLENLPQLLAQSFLEHYQIPSLTPTRDLIDRILRAHPPKPNNAISAAEFHVREMFRLYAASTLHASTEGARVELSTLATVGQPWILRTQSLLQRFSMGRIRITADGRYRVERSRQSPLELSPQEAAAVADTLNRLIALDSAPYGAGVEYHGLLQRPWNAIQRGGPKRPTFPLGLQLVERTRDMLKANDWKVERVAALLTLDLLDAAHEGQGKVAANLKQDPRLQELLEAQ